VNTSIHPYKKGEDKKFLERESEMLAMANVTNTTIVSVIVNGVETPTYSRASAAA
jgi:hypothetical protein